MEQILDTAEGTTQDGINVHILSILNMGSWTGDDMKRLLVMMTMRNGEPTVLTKLMRLSFIGRWCLKKMLSAYMKRCKSKRLMTITAHNISIEDYRIV